MSLIPPPCLQQGCFSESIKGKSYCKEHMPEAFAGNFRKERLPRDWDVIRTKVLIRDNYVCYVCNRDGADGVDHVNIEGGDNDNYSNLAAIHQNVEPFCHREKTAREAAKARAAQSIVFGGESLIERAKKMGLI